MIRLKQYEDEDEARELHRLAFPHDIWTPECRDGVYWIAKRDSEIVGFCAAKYYEDEKRVDLSRAAVIKTAHGCGLQRRMINVRCNWGKRMGAVKATSYTSLKNYASMMNLLKCGFRFDRNAYDDWDDEGCHFFSKTL